MYVKKNQIWIQQSEGDWTKTIKGFWFALHFQIDHVVELGGCPDTLAKDPMLNLAGKLDWGFGYHWKLRLDPRLVQKGWKSTN